MIVGRGLGETPWPGSVSGDLPSLDDVGNLENWLKKGSVCDTSWAGLAFVIYMHPLLRVEGTVAYLAKRPILNDKGKLKPRWNQDLASSRHRLRPFVVPESGR